MVSCKNGEAHEKTDIKPKAEMCLIIRFDCIPASSRLSVSSPLSCHAPLPAASPTTSSEGIYINYKERHRVLPLIPCVPLDPVCSP